MDKRSYRALTKKADVDVRQKVEDIIYAHLHPFGGEQQDPDFDAAVKIAVDKIVKVFADEDRSEA